MIDALFDCQVHPVVAALIEMKLVFHEAGRLRANRFHLMPSECLKLKVVTTGLPNGRVVMKRRAVNEASIQDLLMLQFKQMNSEAKCTESGHGLAVDTSADSSTVWNDGLIGPLLLGIINLEYQWNESDKKPSNVSIEESTRGLSNDVTQAHSSIRVLGDIHKRSEIGNVKSFDIIGYLYAGPTAVVIHSLTTSERSESNGVLMQPVRELRLSAINPEVADSEPASSIRPTMYIDDHSIVQLSALNLNQSSQQLRFESIPTCCRGLKLKYPRSNADTYFVTDTIAAVPTQSSMSLNPQSAQVFDVKISPSSIVDFSDLDSWKYSNGMIVSSKSTEVLPAYSEEDSHVANLGLYDICSLQIRVTDDNFPLHQPGTIDICLQSSVPIPIIRAIPVTTSSYHHKQVGRLKANSPRGSHESLSTLRNVSGNKLDEHSNATGDDASQPQLRIRGCAQFHSSATSEIEQLAQFEVNLGQQVRPVIACVIFSKPEQYSILM